MSPAFPPELDALWVEDRGPIAAPTVSTQLELYQAEFETRFWEKCLLLSEARMLGVLRGLSEHGINLQATLGVPLPEIDENPDAAVWTLWRDSLGAVVLGHSVDSVLDGRGRKVKSSLQEVQWAELKAHGGVVGDGRHRGTVAFDESVAAPKLPSIFEGDLDPNTRRRQIDAALRRSLRSVVNIKTVRKIHVEALVDFVGEVIENTCQHALFDMERRRIRGLRFLLVRRINVATPQDEARVSQRSGVGALGAYFADISHILAEARPSRRRLIEVTVSDSGAGISASLSGDPTIYLGDVAKEIELTKTAMLDGVTSKDASVDGAGLGLWKAQMATRDLGGIMVVRTGRVQLTYSSLVENGAWIAEERGYQAGTSVSVVWPWVTPEKGFATDDSTSL